MSRTKTIWCLLALVVAACVISAFGQRPGNIAIRQNPRSKWFSIRVVNQLKVPVYYKLVAGEDKSYVHETLQPGQSEPDDVTGGQKVLCVWDKRDRVIMVCGVFVDREGDIVIGDWDQVEDDWREAAPPGEVVPPSKRDPNDPKIAYAPKKASPRRLKIK